MSDDIEIIDAHHHFWDLNQNYYPFLSNKIDENFFLGNYEFIRKNYLPNDYLNDSKEHNVIGTIHCEAEWDRNDQVGETRWLENLSKKNKYPNAIVAHAWFHKKNSEEIVAKQASFDMVKGIRSKPITKLLPNSDDLTGEGSMQDINWRNGLKLLEKFNLNYDLRVPNWHLEEAIEIVRLIPNTKVIINHAGFPWDRTKQGMEYWRKGIKLMSLEPNTFIKLSEFGVKDKDWDYSQNEQIIKELIDLFSPQRCMFASNFPVSKIKISFKDLYNNYKKIVKSFSSDEKKWLFAKTASEVYNL